MASQLASRSFAPLLLLPLALALLPFGRAVEIPMGILSIFGVIALFRGIRISNGPPWRALGALYAAFLLPMLFGLVDAVALEKSFMTTIGSMRFVLSCCALLWLLQEASAPEQLQQGLLRLFGAVAWLLCVLWSLDGLLQFLRGSNILGYGLGEGYVNGIFGNDDNIKLGLTLAVLLPFALVSSLREMPAPVALASVALILTIILLSGKRAAWITAFVELAAVLVYYRLRGRLGLRTLVVVITVGALAAVLAYGGSAWVRARSDILVDAAMEPSYDAINQATGKRLPIWQSAVRMGSDNWVNGVGPRGFRYAYRDYADPGDEWAAPMGRGNASRASHAHQLLLDVFAESGIIGIFGYASIVVLLFYLWLRAGPGARTRALPAGVVLLGMLFPVNTHPAWYSSWFGLLLWLCIGIYLFALYETPGASSASDSVTRGLPQDGR